MTMTAQQARDAQDAALPLSAAVIQRCWDAMDDAVLIKDGPKRVVVFEADADIVTDIVTEFETAPNSFAVTQGAGNKVAISWSSA